MDSYIVPRVRAHTCRAAPRRDRQTRRTAASSSRGVPPSAARPGCASVGCRVRSPSWRRLWVCCSRDRRGSHAVRSSTNLLNRGRVVAQIVAPLASLRNTHLRSTARRTRRRARARPRCRVRRASRRPQSACCLQAGGRCEACVNAARKCARGDTQGRAQLSRSRQPNKQTLAPLVLRVGVRNARWRHTMAPAGVTRLGLSLTGDD